MLNNSHLSNKLIGKAPHPKEYFKNKIEEKKQQIKSLETEIKTLEKSLLNYTDAVLVPHFNKPMKELELLDIERTETGIGLEEDRYYHVAYGCFDPQLNTIYVFESEYIKELLQIPTPNMSSNEWRKKWKKVSVHYKDEGYQAVTFKTM